MATMTIKLPAFTATQWDTAEVKAKFARTLIRFILDGFQREKFTKAFYTRLSNTYGHIAHTNQDGFYGTWFADSERQRKFIVHLLDARTPGSPAFTYSDVEQAVQDWVRENYHLVDAVLATNRDKELADERHEKARVLATNSLKTQQFKVFRKSENTGSFGHRQYFILAQDGSAYTIEIVPSNLELALNQILDVPLRNGRPDFSQFRVECPERLKDAPASVIKQVWS